MLAVVREAAARVFVPLTIGGGIKDTRDPDGTPRPALEVASAYFRAGADKVSIGSEAVYVDYSSSPAPGGRKCLRANITWRSTSSSTNARFFPISSFAGFRRNKYASYTSLANFALGYGATVNARQRAHFPESERGPEGVERFRSEVGKGRSGGKAGTSRTAHSAVMASTACVAESSGMK